MRRSPIEKLRARWVTGHYGHGAAFGMDLALTLRMWVRWRLAKRRGDVE